MGERSARGGRRRSEGGSGEQGRPEVDWDRVRELTLGCAGSSDAQPKPGGEIFQLRQEGRLWIVGEQLERTEEVEKPTRSKETKIARFQLAFSSQKGGSLKPSEGPLLDEIRETG